METLLLYVIALLSVTICALGGFWFYRAARARKQSARPPQSARSAAGRDQWEAAVRAYRNRV